ncbi:uncharacterized protein LOC113510411 [Galleria mellonella]|uniref:Uncharacterized protein LOC113510411 n=1 Tax=Galleria mellonella TaxID=7137 RepID=A0A6J3BZM7_GALME|nr:uncharacterized protein LOC113510411 [Galleria mellonella]
MEKLTLKKIEELNVDHIVKLLDRADLTEFAEFVKERNIDGRKLLDVTEGIVKLWRPSVNAKKFILFIEEFKLKPDKYLERPEKDVDVIRHMESKNISIECQYQTVPARRIREDNMASTTLSSVEELLKKLVPAKSFLYRNQPRTIERSVPSYMPMDGGPKKPKRFFRLSSYEYPHFDLWSRTSKHETFDDRGYYSVKTNNRYFIQKTYKRQDSKTKYKSLSTAEEFNEKLPEDHFYEDLCYSDMNNSENKTENANFNQVTSVKPCMVKIQELFQSFKMPFFRKNEIVSGDKSGVEDKTETVIETNVYENSDSATNMYDSIHVVRPVIDGSNTEKNECKLPVEDYLEPVQLNKDYCDVTVRERDDSLLGYIMSIFDNRFGFRRETNDAAQYDDEEKAACTPSEEGRKERPRTNMAGRPLPVPVENEPYYMNIDRAEAENLLMGQPDGMFILRPSSQPTHAYTLSVACSNAVHNVGVRRRPDGRLALGFPRRGERSFASVTSLLRHHRRRRLLLVAAGGVIGATTLTETPHYYQTPSNLPVL